MSTCVRLATTIFFFATLPLPGETAALAGTTPDVAGDASETIADMVAVRVRVEQTDVQFIIETAKPYGFPNTQLLLDTDRDCGTGFTDGSNGFDVLVEGDSIFKFCGTDRTQWNWQRVEKARRTVVGSKLFVRLPRDLLKADFDLSVRTLTAGYTQIDRVPDTGAVRVSLESVTDEHVARSGRAEPVESTGDAAEAAKDITAVAVLQRESRIVVDVKARGPGDFAQLLMFFDTDLKAETGYQSGAVADYGFDALLSGGRVLRFNGPKPDVWAWEGMDDAVVTVDGNRYRAEFDAGMLSSRKARAVAMMMSADWQTVIDVAPDEGAIDLQIDTSKIGRRKEAPTLAAPRENRQLPPRDRFVQAESFYCYYGSGKVAALSHYDIVIAHSPQMQPADINKLKELGVVVVGYITIGEDGKLRKGDGKGPGGYAGWYFDEDDDNQPDQNSIWKSYYANANDPAWRADRVAEARRLLSEEGYDGIFLDTIDTASAYPKTEPGMLKLVGELRAALTDAPIVLNQGFPLLARLAPLVDGLMIESFTTTYDFRTRKYVLHSPSSLDWTRGVAERIIKPALNKNPLKVLVLDYALPGDRDNIQTAADRAATFGYLFSVGPITLDAVYNTDIRGKPDSKWLVRQATPNSMKYTLEHPANGFPSSTILTPSGCYRGYKVNPVVDGIRDRDKLFWADAAWASAEDGEDAWLELRFPQPLSSGWLRIQWTVDNDRLHASRRYRVEVLRGGNWDVIDRVESNTQAVNEHELPDKPFNAIRIHQPTGGGSAHRPDLMWVAQVERRGSS